MRRVDTGARKWHALRRWLLPGLVFAVLSGALLHRFSQIEQAARTLERGQWQWLLTALLFQAAYYGLYAANYRQAFLTVGMRERTRDLLPVLVESQAVGEVVPVGWAAGSAVFVRYAVRRGNSPEQAFVGTLLAQAADLIAFSLTFFVGMLFLFFRHDLHRYVMVGACSLLLMNAVLGGILALALWRPDLMGRLVRRLPPRFGRLVEAGQNVSGVAAEVRTHPREAARALAAALGANAANLCGLFLVFRAFAQPVGFGPLVAGYGVGTLAWMLSPVPAGVGVVEGAMALAYASLGVPAGSATVIAVAYRGLNFWLPFLIGIVLVTVRRRPDAERVERTEGAGGGA